jgi:hypothetical protein
LVRTWFAAAAGLCTILTAIRSRLPEGMSGRSRASKRWFRTIVQLRPGLTSLIRYAPTPGGGVALRSRIGVPLGTRPVAGSARMFSNAPHGRTRLMVIWPVASSASIPEISLACPWSKAAAPTTFSVRKRLPGQPRRIARSIAYSKSPATTGLPLE